ncbi:DNA binding protein [Phytophthora megakarya]|uniref:DNA binding protein n=1 Tax=Phytophthora megakarya TaxID=4795 RepID=A0A225VZW4_9STRA|nr:DNA binding protein [Phytophthora megakarya]
MILGDSTGAKYPPFVIFKMKPSKIKETRDKNESERHGFSLSMWKKHIVKAQNDTGMQVYTNTKGWWNHKMTINFLQFHISNRQNMSEPILLLLDDFSGHWTEDVIEYAKTINVTLMKVPPNATSVSQPADATWNGPLKVRLRNMWIQYLREKLRARKPGDAFKLKAPSRGMLCEWIHSTWSDVEASTIVSGFRKCGFVERDVGPETINETSAEQEDFADDIIEEVIEAGWIDQEVGSFTLDDDFDEIFRSVVEHNTE